MILKKRYRVSIDRLNGRFISGWCFNRLRKDKPVTITIAADGEVLGSLSNRGLRRDLLDLKLHPSGVCGFDFSFPSTFDPAAFQFLHLYFDGQKTPALSIACSEIEMLRADLERPVSFMHIPKTAGTSFNAFARQCFSSERFITHIERLEPEARRKETADVDYLSGHLIFGDLAALAPSHCSTVAGAPACDFYAIIREPYAHLHSHLNYVRGVLAASRDEAHYEFKHNQSIKLLSARLNEIDFGSLGEVSHWVEDLQGYERDFFDNLQTRYFLDERPETVGEDALARARDNLKKFRLVGLTERYDLFRERFCRHLGLPLVEQPLKSNISESYRLFDPADLRIRSALYPLVAYDLKLYQYVEHAFWQE
jgi:hypothetical protein